MKVQQKKNKQGKKQKEIQETNTQAQEMIPRSDEQVNKQTAEEEFASQQLHVFLSHIKSGNIHTYTEGFSTKNVIYKNTVKIFLST